MTDARRQSPAEQQKRRLEVVRLDEEGVGVMEIVRRTELSWNAVRRTIDQYQAAGIDGLAPATRGRKPGSGALLTADQQAEIRRLMRRRPRQLQLNGWLWTRAAAIDLVKREFGVTLTEHGFGNYLVAWGITLAQQERPPQNRCSPEVRSWLATRYAGVVEQAKANGEKIFWLYRPKTLSPELWSPPPKSNAEEAPGLSRGITRLSVVMAINNQGKQFWVIAAGTVDAPKQAKFINGLMRDAGGCPIVAIRDDAKAYATADLRENINARLLPTPEDLETGM